MANIAKFNGRVIQKHDTAEHWKLATNFVPLKGEIIVYEDTNQIKIGDGTTVVDALPFAYPEDIEIEAGSSTPDAQEAEFGAAFNIPNITYDKHGRITNVTNAQVVLPQSPANTNTTYTFTNGTASKPNKFTVTPSTNGVSGDSVDVSIAPSITVGVTTSGSGSIVTNVQSGTNGVTITKTSLANLGIGSPFNFQGTKTWAQLIGLSSAAKGDVYNISDKDPTGKTGQNWVCIKAVSGTAPGSANYTEYWDALGGTMDLSNYAVLNTTTAQTFTGDLTFSKTSTVPGIKTSTGTGAKVFLDNGTLKAVSDFATSTQYSGLTDEVNKKLSSGNDAVGYEDLAFAGAANSWSSLSIGKKSKNGILSLYKNNTYMDIKIDGELSAKAELKIPAASGTLATREWVISKGYTTNTGTVTSVGLSMPTGFTVSKSPVTSSGTLTVAFTSGYSLPTIDKQNKWDDVVDAWEESNLWHLNLNGTAIPKNSDLNSYTTPGSYYSFESAVSQTLSNCPHTGSGFRMVVMLTYGDNRVVQWIFPSSGAMYFRMYNGTSSATWGDWRTIITDSGSRTIIGGITLKNPSANTNSVINAIQYINAHNTTTFNPLQLITGDANGAGVLLGAGGTTIVGGGESAANLWEAIKANAGAQTESLHLANDGDITFHSNCQTVANRKTATFNTSGNWTIPGRYVGTNATSGSWYQGRDLATFQETRASTQSGYHALWSLKTTNGSWDFGEYESGTWYDVPVMTYITDTNYSGKNNETTYQLKFPLASGTIATTSNIGDGTLTISTSGTGIGIGSTNASFKANASSNATIQIALDSSAAGNRSKNQVVLAAEAGQINSEKFTVTSSGTAKATIQYNSTYKAVEFVF